MSALNRPTDPASDPSALGTFRWDPSRDTVVALASYVLVVAAIWLAFEYFTTARVAMNFITYGVIALGLLGVVGPVLYTALVRHRPLSDLGITTKQIAPSLLLGLLMGATTYFSTIRTLGVAWDASHIPLVTMSLAVGLFEAVFFRGWLQLTFERAFGLVPGLAIAAGAYSLYHVGYGMDAGTLVELFYYGLIFGGLFRLTSNILVVWPFYTPVGALYSRLVDGLELPFPATYGFLIVLAMMFIAMMMTTPKGRRIASIASGAALVRAWTARRG